MGGIVIGVNVIKVTKTRKKKSTIKNIVLIFIIKIKLSR